jgi:hypothetical protein
VAILTVALVGTAFAVNTFGFRDMIMPNPDLVITFDDFQGTEEQYKAINPDGTLDDFTIIMDEFLLSGFVGSPEYEAAKEWRNNDIIYVDIDGISVGVRRDWETGCWVNSETGEFVAKEIIFIDSQEALDSMTTEELEDNIVILRSGDIPEMYLWYGALSWADVERINGIVQRYGLVLYGELFNYFENNRSWDEFQASVAKGQFVDNSDNSFTLLPGYRWESGTFKFEAQYGDIWFSLRSSRKGTFDTVIISNLDINEFTDEWAYVNVHGTNLMLAQSANQSFIIADTETAFIVVSVHAGTGASSDWVRVIPGITRNELEHFADLIDFSQLK